MRQNLIIYQDTEFQSSLSSPPSFTGEEMVFWREKGICPCIEPKTAGQEPGDTQVSSPRHRAVSTQDWLPRERVCLGCRGSQRPHTCTSHMRECHSFAMHSGLKSISRLQKMVNIELIIFLILSVQEFWDGGCGELHG